MGLRNHRRYHIAEILAIGEPIFFVGTPIPSVHMGFHDEPMNTVHPQAPEQPDLDCHPSQHLREQIEDLAEAGIDVFVFASEGRLLDASAGCTTQAIEQIAAISSALVNGARGYGDRTQGGGVERLVSRYSDGALVLLPINEVVWAGCLTDHDSVSTTAHALSLFTERVAAFVPDEVGLSLPAVALSAAGNGGW